MRTGRAHHNFKDGYWSDPQRSTLYKPKPAVYRPIVSARRRELLVAWSASLLKFWRSSPFEYEGTCRHMIRAHLVTMGHGWSASDLEADKIVSTALRKMGAVRPSWAEGQPEHTRIAGQCLCCGANLRPLPGKPQTSFFCAEVVGRETCESRYNRLRGHAFWFSRTAEAKESYRAAMVATIPARHCEHCRKNFKPLIPDARFCSATCSRHARGDLLEHADCQHCGLRFKPATKTKATYCSPECSSAGRTVVARVPCQTCGGTFKGYRAKKFCSPACYRAAPRPDTQCVQCGTTFCPSTATTKTCSDDCRRTFQKAYNRDRKAAKRAAAKASEFTCSPCE